MSLGARLEIMVVDDQRAMRALVHGSLVQLGCRKVVECGDGQEALDHLENHRIDLIISDLNMPRMDGLELLAAVRKKPGLEKVAFIMLTSRGETELVRKAIALGVNNYLMKPFSVSGLKEKVEAVVGKLA